jgi:thiamine biosynthesis protein ThiS
MEAAAAVTLRVNGHQREAPTGWTVADLVAELAPDVRMVAVERNGAIVPRAAWSATALAQGDRLEVVRFVQGG